MRIVAVSDLHGHLPSIPPCDLLLIAGDICPDVFDRTFARYVPQKQPRWFNDCFRPWLAAQPARYRILIWGNHDWCGEVCDFSADAAGTGSLERVVILNDDSVHVPIHPITHSPTVGAFEGANYEARGFYRPEVNCIMFTQTTEFCAVCRRAIERVVESHVR